MAVQAKSAIDNGEDTARACLWVEESAMPFVETKMKDLKIDVLDGERNGELKYFWVSGSNSKIWQLRQDLLGHIRPLLPSGTSVKMEQMTPFGVYIPRSITATLYCNFKLFNVSDKVSHIMEKIYFINADYSSSTITYHISMVEAPAWNFTIIGGKSGLDDVNADQSDHSILVDIDSDGFEDGHLGNPKDVVLQAIKDCDWVKELICDVNIKQKTKAKSLK